MIIGKVGLGGICNDKFFGLWFIDHYLTFLISNKIALIAQVYQQTKK